MNSLLKSLDFISLQCFLKKFGIEYDEPFINNIFIYTTTSYEHISSYNNLTVNEIIIFSVKKLLSSKEKNVLCTGYILENGSIKVQYPNSSANRFKTKNWSQFLKSLNSDFSIFLLTKCTIVEKLNNYILLTGSFNNIFNKKEYFNREILWKRKISYKKLKIEDFIKPDCKFYTEEKNEKVKNFIYKFEKLNVNSIFNSFFNNDVSFYTSYESIINFLFMISKKVLNSIIDFENFRVLKSKIKILIVKNKYENITKTELIEYFKINKFKIFKDKGNLKKLKCNKLEYENRVKFITQFLYNLFSKVYIPIISHFFYTTESTKTKYQLFFIKRAKWYKFEKEKIENFLNTNFILEETFLTNNNQCLNNISDKEILEYKIPSFFSSTTHRKIVKYPTIRLIPKDIENSDKCRVIINMKKSNNVKFSNINLNSIHKILSSELMVREDIILSYKDLLDKLNILDVSNKYILKLDIKNCYDNIPINILLNLIKNIFTKEIYYIKKYSTIEKVSEKYIIKNRKIITKVDNIFYLPKIHKNSIIWDNVYTEKKSKDKIIAQITALLTENKIFYSNKLYRQKDGIPQGSILSSLLCSLYYSDIYNNYFTKIFKKGKIIRYVDDFLIVTNDIKEIIEFFLTIKNRKGLEINYTKMESNFNLENIIEDKLDVNYKNNEEIEKKKFISYCGIKINTLGFKIDNEYTKLPYSLSHKNNNYKNNIHYKLTRILKRKLHPLFFYKNFYRKQNIYDILYFFYKKLYYSVTRSIFCNSKFIEKLINYPDKFLKGIGDNKIIKSIKQSALKDSYLLFYMKEKELYKKYNKI